MPRQFDGSRVRAVRRRLELKQKELGEKVGVSAASVTRWELGEDFPKGEKLPAIAAALGEPLDVLFPYEGRADLQILRCDAQLSVAQAAAVIGASRVPVSNAESGRRRLQDAYVGALAHAYGVTEEELLAAQDVSFGSRQAAPPRNEHPPTPRTVGEKINYLLQQGYTDRTPPSDEQIAWAVNDHTGMPSTTAEDIAALRMGRVTDVPDAVRAGLAHAFQADVALFQDDAEITPEARELVEAVQFVRSIREGDILGLAARGNEAGLSPAAITAINKVLGELRNKLPDLPDER
ncbi:helix-turn-helix domain-containing protein [Streptomyces sp. NPDC088768]|uniref:helix-turn-helix domain-containing protein n=1 Tax=Streptomyces sp. NPDC088768 TaxID=3365894 RepID=UPI003803B754